MMFCIIGGLPYTVFGLYALICSGGGFLCMATVCAPMLWFRLFDLPPQHVEGKGKCLS